MPKKTLYAVVSERDGERVALLTTKAAAQKQAATMTEQRAIRGQAATDVTLLPTAGYRVEPVEPSEET